MSEDTVQQQYKIFLSCKDDLIISDMDKKISDTHIEKLLKKHVKDTKNADIDIECIKRPENVNSAKQDIDMVGVKKNCVYVIDTHSDLDNIAYWQLGYAMGRDIKIIGYYAGKETDKKISEDVNQLTGQFHSANSKRFLELISAHITNTIGARFSDWDKLYDGSKTEPEAT